MKNKTEIPAPEAAHAAKQASFALAAAPGKARSSALLAVAAALRAKANMVFKANEIDMRQAEKEGLADVEHCDPAVLKPFPNIGPVEREEVDIGEEEQHRRPQRGHSQANVDTRQSVTSVLGAEHDHSSHSYDCKVRSTL